MRNGKTPEYVFLAAFLQLQVAQEYLTLLRSVKGPYAAAVRRQLAAALAALYSSDGCCGGAGCMEALQERCTGHRAFSADDGAQILSQICGLRRRYASLFRNAASDAVSAGEADRFISDTESALRSIGSRLFAAAPAQANGRDFIEQYERLQKSRKTGAL